MTLISAQTASELLGLSRPTVTKLARDGRLPVVGFMNGRYAIFERDVVLAHRGRFADIARPRKNGKVAA